ncbi:MAG TPA: cyclopropane-fatty-acyl-phospholipid synthase family protein [Steroidobacteraceae bacterium]|nr:cyclopropane-fatty-acyl-phospholipid synthase family protein [Steroidobacteraceae bacterium]
MARRLLFAQLATLQDGALTLYDCDGTRHQFGRTDAPASLQATVRIHDPVFYTETVWGGTVGSGAAFIDGSWDCDDLTALMRVVVANRAVMDRLDSRWALVSRPFLKLHHWLNRNTRRGSARNIAAHYDLGNAFYELMLDETMAYSCAIFPTEDATLAEASRAKFDAACRKLELGPSDHLLEIGTGWGGLAIHAATHYGCRVTTTTISQQQYDYAAQRVGELGLTDRITLLREDYRDLKGQYDKLVSIEMIEAVGARFLDTYFAKCSSLLRRSGAMLLQAITLQDQYYEASLRSVDFIQRFVFPGSFIPSVTAMADSLRRVTDLKIFHLEDIGPHYARTLATWRNNFLANLAEVRRLQYPETFIRLWQFYLSYCEAGFAERQLGDVQMLLTKPGCRRPTLSLVIA